MAHTPGPWSSDMPFVVAPDPSGTFNDIYIATIADSDEEGRCEQDTDTLVANAHLIAAAPELLDLCEELFDLVQKQVDSLDYDYDRIVGVIQKAKGEA